MSDEEVEGLLQDIRENGLREPVVMFEGMVLDGWHRVQMCGVAGIEIRTRDFPDNLDPKKYVLSKNLHRRSLTPSQRAAAVVMCQEWVPDGYNQHQERGVETVSTPPSTNAEMANQAGVSTRTISDAKTAVKTGQGDAVKRGEKSAHQAASEAKGKTTQKKSPTEKLQEQLAEAKQRVAELEQSIEDLQDEIRLGDFAEKPQDQQTQEFAELQGYANTLRSQLNEALSISANRQKEIGFLKRRLKEAGVEI